MICAKRCTNLSKKNVFNIQTRSLFGGFGLPDFSTGNDNEFYRESKVLPYAQRDLYNLVANVNEYKNFVPYCTHSRILTKGPIDLHKSGAVEAELGVGFQGFEERYNSVVTLDPYKSVTARANSKTPLFKTLQTKYTFTPKAQHTELAIELEYAFANPLYATLSSTFFSGVSAQMVKAFEERAKVVCNR